MTENIQITPNPRIVLVGSVNSSQLVLAKLIQHKMNLVEVLGLDPKAARNVSGFRDLQPVAKQAAIPFAYFERINDESVVDLVRNLKPDLLFVIGLSQLIGKTLLNVPTHGVVGYHPTKLPKGRGRAAIAWILLGKVAGAASLFMIDQGVDAGPILTQEPIEVTETDYAQDVVNKLMEALGKCCDRLFPQLRTGQLTYTHQNQNEATYLGIRKREDGLIDWNQSAADLARLVRALSHPLPGAFTVYKRTKLFFWRVNPETDFNHSGVPGRILRVEPNGFYVATGDGALKITDYSSSMTFVPKVGSKLGFEFDKVFIDE